MNSYQEYFISRYIESHKKERLIYELNSKNKKYKFMDHFCHNINNYIVSKKIVFIGNLSNVINHIRTKDIFFVMSYDNINGKMMYMDELIEYLENEYMPVLAISNSFVIIKNESDDSSNIFVLRE